MSRTENLNRALRGLSTTTPDIEAAAIVDNDGLVLASSLPADMEEDSVAAMSAALLGISERIAGELGRGEMELTMIRGADGFVVLTRAGDESVLVALTTKRAKLGLIFLDIKRAAADVARILG